MGTGEDRYRRFLEGDEKAFDDVVIMYRPGLIRFVDSYVHDIYTSEDIAIDCFAYLLVHPKRYNFKTPLKSYLYVLGRSRALDHLRKIKRRGEISHEEAESELTDFEEISDKVINTEQKKALRRALDTLPEEMRQAVSLFYFDELSYNDIALILKKKPKQIDNLLYRAREKLRTALSVEGGGVI
ncbi:MAG: RNA polymerase sigma factor [Clostridia bacterium]|nr:RNA polymerase sigma factor [Clostridia bacterium]